MDHDNPLSPLILWVPPAIAAACERLTVAQQNALTQVLTDVLQARLDTPPRGVLTPQETERMAREYVNDLRYWQCLPQEEDGIPF